MGPRLHLAASTSGTAEEHLDARTTSIHETDAFVRPDTLGPRELFKIKESDSGP